MAPRNIHVLIIPRIYEYATLCGKRDFADVINGKDVEMGRLSWINQMGPV